MGSEFAYEDISSQEVEKYTYKYLKTEACGTEQCLVVERFPVYEHSGYTRHVAWIDTKEFRVMKVDYYDRKDALLKTLTNEGYALYLDRFWRASKMTMKNHQKGKYTEFHWNNYRFGRGLEDSDFTKAKLKQAK
jgi:outer membrane lipoprotein-sorting protein